MIANIVKRAAVLLTALAIAPMASAQTSYDLVLKGGHVIDPANNLSAVRDVAIKDQKIAAVAPNIPAAQATRTADVTGLYVTPGLVDIHVHVFPGEKGATYAGGDRSVWADDFTLRTCTTTVADAGSSGWRSFDDFKRRSIDRSISRIVAFLNVVGVGMREGQLEQNVNDMEVQPAIDLALKHKGVIIGVKSAHYSGPGWTPYENAEAIGRAADIPVMVDFGSNLANGRTIMELFTKYFRPGDIFTHMYGGNRGEQDPTTRGPSEAFIEGRKRGIILDVGHGGGSFRWSAAWPMLKAGFVPDSISTDLHTSSSQSGMKDMLDVMSKFLAMGRSLDEVIKWSTVNPAREIKLPQLGNLSVGAPADVAVLRVDKGKFGFMDQVNMRVEGSQKLACEITLRDGAPVYDANGRTRDAFDPNAPLPARGRGRGAEPAPARGRGAAPTPASTPGR
jgi:dihydroorotase